ncbi:MAG: DEAD/DEAH box helicase [Planctomycetes bacterium]|nr:DEAD/DEAH box helicase [Planctomycetota bacterium]
MNPENASFDRLGLDDNLLGVIRDKQFTQPTDIQAQTLPHALKGRDILGCAQTGTGKTAAFALPIIQRLYRENFKRGWRPIRSLIVAPTRELAAQIGEEFREFGTHCGLRHTVIFGGVNQRPQCKNLRRGVDILIATPGRLLDLINQGEVDLDRVEILVLDEADRMLDMGFLPDIKRIVKLVPDKRQTMLFSATMPPAIDQISASLLHNPFSVTIAPEAPAADTVDQAVHFVENNAKLPLLTDLLACSSITKAIVFTRTKHRADTIARKLDQASIPAAAMHSNKSQNQRQRTLGQLRSGKLRVLVASDIASRGIDVADISHVFNYDMPNEAETYVHRIGRTGRAGMEGKAVSFCSDDERPLLAQVERLLTKELDVAGGQRKAASAPSAKPDCRGQHNRSRRGRCRAIRW